MPETKDYYEILGVARGAGQKEIQSAFRKLARQHHPDMNRGDKAAEQRFKDLNQAQEVLSDPRKRKLYDRFGKNWEQASAAGADRPGAGSAGRQGARARVDSENLRDLFGGGDGQPLSDLFGNLFGGGGRGRSGPVTMEAEGVIQVTLQEAFTGAIRRFEMPDGRRVEVRVPAGVVDGTVLRVPGLLARVEVAADTTFAREGRDLRTVVSVPLATALLGGEVEVPILKGGRVNLRVPAETQNGTRLRLRGLGMPGAGAGAAGDLYAEVKVSLPLPLDERTRRWAQELPGSA